MLRGGRDNRKRENEGASMARPSREVHRDGMCEKGKATLRAIVAAGAIIPVMHALQRGQVEEINSAPGFDYTHMSSNHPASGLTARQEPAFASSDKRS